MPRMPMRPPAYVRILQYSLIDFFAILYSRIRALVIERLQRTLGIYPKRRRNNLQRKERLIPLEVSAAGACESWRTQFAAFYPSIQPAID